MPRRLVETRLLGFGSLFAEATIENVLGALGAVPTMWVNAWCSAHSGQTFQSGRIEASVPGAQQELPEPTMGNLPLISSARPWPGLTPPLRLAANSRGEYRTGIER